MESKLSIVMVFLVESTKSIKPIQHFMELPENLIPPDEKFFIYCSLRNRNYVKYFYP